MKLLNLPFDESFQRNIDSVIQNDACDRFRQLMWHNFFCHTTSSYWSFIHVMVPSMIGSVRKYSVMSVVSRLSPSIYEILRTNRCVLWYSVLLFDIQFNSVIHILSVAYIMTLYACLRYVNYCYVFMLLQRYLRRSMLNHLSEDRPGVAFVGLEKWTLAGTVSLRHIDRLFQYIRCDLVVAMFYNTSDNLNVRSKITN